MEIIIGAEIKVIHPFVKQPYSYWDNDYEGGGMVETMTWKPGTEPKMVSPDDAEEFAEAEGYQVLTVISTHKPSPRYPERVFYTRKWIDPDGKEFGLQSLRIATMQKFKRIVNGYRVPYKISGAP